MNTKPVHIRNRTNSVIFDVCGGGFPSWVGFSGPEGEETVSRSERPWLTVKLPDGSCAMPFWPEGHQPTVTTAEEATRLEFRNLPQS